jgi:hypothetical protein
MNVKRFGLILILLFLFNCNSLKDEKLTWLQGAWAKSKDDNVSFIIEKDRIQYLEYEGNFTIKINDDKMTLYEDFVKLSEYHILLLTSDSLHLKTEEGNTIKYCKIPD